MPGVDAADDNAWQIWRRLEVTMFASPRTGQLAAKDCRAGFLLPFALTALAAAVALADDRGSSAVDLYGDEIPAGAAVRLGTVRYRGSGWKVPPLFTAGDDTLITLSGHRQLAVLEAATGKRIRVIELGEQNVTGVCLSPDRRSVFTVGHEFQEAAAQNVQTVKNWDLGTGEMLQSLQFTERSGGETFALTPDGRTIVTGGGDGTLHFWDLATGDEVLTYRIDQQRIDTLAISPNGKLIAVSASNNVFLWEWTAGSEAEKIPVGLHVTSLAFSPNGSILAEGPDSQTQIVLRDTGSRKVLRTLEDAGRNQMYVTSLAFTPDGRSLVAANPIGLRGREIEYRVHEWDVATGLVRRQLATEGMRPSLVAISGDGRWLAASTGYDSTVMVWDRRTGKLMGGDMPAHDGTVNSIHLASDGSTAVTAGQDGTIRVWEAKTGKQQHLLRHAYWVRGCALSGDSRLIASSSLDDTVRLWDASTGNEVYKFPGHGDLGGVRAVAFAPDQSRFASWGDDFYLRIWDVKTAKALQEWRVHPPEMKIPEGDEGDQFREHFMMQVSPAVFSQDARSLILGYGSSILVFDVATGQLQSKLTHDDGHIISLVVSASGKLIATSAWGRPIETKLADGRTRFSAGKNHKARVLDVASGAERFCVELPDEGAGPVAFSADDRWLAVASQTSHAIMRVLDATSGDELTTMANLPSGANTVCFSADGEHLACGFRDGTALIWDLNIPENKR
jgi:WD40 repeat protein